LQVSTPGDQHEQEADRVAEQVMRMPDPVVQRQCQSCSDSSASSLREEEPRIQRQTNGDGGARELTSDLTSHLGAGAPLDTASRRYFEPRFGHDFGNVRIHDGPQAATAAARVQARAFTLGHDVVFAAGEHEPGSDRGKRLLAHELTHVVQQNSNSAPSKKIQRALGIHTHCTPNVDSAPADPLEVLGRVNDRAVIMSLGASMLLFSDSIFLSHPELGPSTTLNLYRRRFGDPIAAGHNFKNRFNNSLHQTLALAQSSEMQFLARRLENISHFLGKHIHFKCTGTHHTHIGSCTHHCGATTVMGACASGHGNAMAVCPLFWTISTDVDLRAVAMIHEISHMHYHYNDHDTTPAGTFGARRSEPECYASLVADIYGVTPFDPSCPLLPI
jgi:hypothetical protein